MQPKAVRKYVTKKAKAKAKGKGKGKGVDAQTAGKDKESDTGNGQKAEHQVSGSIYAQSHHQISIIKRERTRKREKREECRKLLGKERGKRAALSERES